jgi:hypothetical protein
VTREYELTVAVETSASHAKSFASAVVIGFSRAPTYRLGRHSQGEASIEVGPIIS